MRNSDLDGTDLATCSWQLPYCRFSEYVLRTLSVSRSTKMCSMTSFWYCCLIGHCSSNRKSFSNQRDEPSYIVHFSPIFLSECTSLSARILAYEFTIYCVRVQYKYLVASCLTTHQIKNAIRTTHIQALRPPFNSTPLRCVNSPSVYPRDYSKID